MAIFLSVIARLSFGKPWQSKSFAPRSEGVSNVIEVIQSIDRIHTWGKMKMGIENACGKHKCIENSASPQGEVDSPYCLRFFAKEFKGEPNL